MAFEFVGRIGFLMDDRELGAAYRFTVQAQQGSRMQG